MKFFRFKKLATFAASLIAGLGITMTPKDTGQASQDIHAALDSSSLRTTLDFGASPARANLQEAFASSRLMFGTLGGAEPLRFEVGRSVGTLDANRFVRVASADDVAPARWVAAPLTEEDAGATTVAAAEPAPAAVVDPVTRAVAYVRGDGQCSRSVQRLADRAAEGDLQSVKDLAQKLFNGIGCKKRDEALAVDLYRKAADGGNNQAKLDLAYIEYHGLGGITADQDGALKRMREAKGPRAAMFVAQWTGAEVPAARPATRVATERAAERPAERVAARPAERAATRAAAVAVAEPVSRVATVETSPAAVCTVPRDQNNGEISCKAARDTIRANEYVQLVSERGGVTTKLFMDASSQSRETAQFIGAVLPTALADFRAQQRRALAI